MSFFHDLFINPNSFWLGLIAGALLVWLLVKSRTYISESSKWLMFATNSLKRYFSTGTDYHYRMEITRFTQQQHLASMMFALSEVVVEPQLMIPPLQVSTGEQITPIDTVNLTIPYIPDWPELGAIYQTPTISINKILQNGAKIAIAGNPGSGKTVALAYLALQLARKAPEVGDLGDRIPIFVHAVDVNFPSVRTQPSNTTGSLQDTGHSTQSNKTTSEQTLALVIAQALSHQVSSLTQSRLVSMIQAALTHNGAIILLDGVDELSPDHIQNIHLFVKSLCETFPSIQMVISVSFENMAELPSLGFHVYSLALWSDSEKNVFVKKWDVSWSKLPSINRNSTISPALNQFLTSWLTAHNLPCTPLDMTLKVWAAYAGDILGSDIPNTVEAYLRRITAGHPKERSSLEQLALRMVTNMNPALHPVTIDSISVSNQTDRKLDYNHLRSLKSVKKKQKLSPLFTNLVHAGLLQAHSGARVRFCNPVITGYLAAKALPPDRDPSHILEQPAWSGKSTTLLFLACLGDVSTVVSYLLEHDDYLHQELLRIARWLRVPPINQPWRSLVLRVLVTALNTEKDTLTLTARIITAIALSGEPTVTALFLRMLHSENTNLRHVAALASGVSGDKKSINGLAQLLKDKSPAIVRSATLALVAIGEKQALEIVADALLNGTEIMRQAAAEALANHPIEGYPALRDGSKTEDVRVRHAVIFGLMRIRELWARQILERMQLEDNEWIVRNAAIQAMEEIDLSGSITPKPLPDLTEIPWLIDFAAKQGIGVAPGNPAYALMIEALKKGTEIEQLHALQYLNFYGNNTSLPVIYSWYFGGKGEVRDAAYQALWSLTCSGMTMHSPSQYGFI